MKRILPQKKQEQVGDIVKLEEEKESVYQKRDAISNKTCITFQGKF